jgi:hypothetical protein
VAAGDVNGDGAFRANARILGLRSVAIPVHLESLKLNPNGTSATVSLTKAGTGTLVLTGANNAPLPQIVVELDNGTKWTFTRVILENVIVSSATGHNALPMEQISLNYAKVEGPATGFTAR